MYYVYLLRCADGSLYAGITTDPARRLAEHRAAGARGAKYTAAHGAVRIEALFSAPDRAAASRLEYRLKQLPRARKLAVAAGEALPPDLCGCAPLPLEECRPASDAVPAYTLLRSARRTLSAEIAPGGALLVRAPYTCPDRELAAFLSAHAAWIAAHAAASRARADARPEPDDAQRAALTARARAELPALVARYAAVMGLTPAAVTVTGARKRFGSCSAQDRLCFSWRLMAYPPAAVEYVVVHELAHIVHKNHGPRFYALVASVLPDWAARRALLKT